MVFQCSKLFYYKVSDEFLRQDSQSSYSFGKIQNVGETELFEEKEFSVSLEKDSIIHIYIYIFFFLQKDFAHTKSTKTQPNKSSKRYKRTKIKKCA